MSFPAYENYKESGVEWLGRVPSHWEVRRLKEIAEAFPSNVDKKSYDDDEPVRLCNYTDVYYNDEIKADLPFMEATATPEQIARFTLRAGDVIITKDSETADDIAIAAYVPQNLPGVVCGYHLSMVRAREDNSGAFLKRYFDSRFAKANFAVRANGLTRVGLGQYAVDNVPVPCPPPSEQRIIATFLDRETAKIDALVEAQERLVALSSERISSLAFSEKSIQWAKIGDLVDIVERPAHIDISDTYTRLGIYNRGRGLFHKDPVTGADIGESDFFYVEDGDLIISGQFAWEGSIALAGPEETGTVVSHRYPVLRGREELMCTEAIFSVLSSGYGSHLLRETSRGAAGRNRPLHLESLLREKVPLLPREAQKAIQLAVRTREKVRSEAAHLTRLLQERRASLISAAVTGKIDVRGLVQTAEAA